MRPLRIFLLAMIAGCLTFVAEYESWFALTGYKIEAESQDLEKRLWEIFPQRCIKFWPYLLKDSKGMKEFLERDMPVTVETHMIKLGRFETKINWLKAWVKVDWRSKIWCISRDGRMWLFEQGQNDEGVEKLIWKIPEQGNIDANIQVPMIGVFKSPLDTEVIAKFIDEYKTYDWFGLISEISWDRRAGMDLFILRILKEQQRFEIYFQPDKYSGQDIGTSIESALARYPEGDYLIDATYEGKIFVRGL